MAKSNRPFISVVMPVYNAGPFLLTSINSILNQTYSNFEFIIIDDASTDNSWEIIRNIATTDKRISIYRNRTHQGVSITVKRAIRKTIGQYLARMDADDISLPRRFEKQIKYLSGHPQTVAVGCQCDVIDENNQIIGSKHFPIKFTDIYKYIFSFIPLQQPTLMIAKHRLPKNFIYYIDGMNTAEEVELIFKLFRYGRVENLPETLFQYRIHGKNTSLINPRQTFILTLISRLKAIVKYNYVPSAEGIIMTIIQTIAVMLLPQSVTLWLYAKIKHLAYKANLIPLPETTPGFTAVVS